MILKMLYIKYKVYEMYEKYIKKYRKNESIKYLEVECYEKV